MKQSGKESLPKQSKINYKWLRTLPYWKSAEVIYDCPSIKYKCYKYKMLKSQVRNLLQYNAILCETLGIMLFLKIYGYCHWFFFFFGSAGVQNKELTPVRRVFCQLRYILSPYIIFKTWTQKEEQFVILSHYTY